MIRLFRKIRHRLLSENSYGIYILYASGEILLVIVGILLALQIDNWSQARTDTKSESYFLNQIRLELISDSLTVHQHKLVYENNLILIASLVEAIHQSDNMGEFNAAVRNYLDEVWSALFIAFNNATFEEMKSSGKLGIIKSNALRNSIVSIYGQLSYTQQVVIANSNFLSPMDVKLSFDYSMARFLEEQQPLFGKYISEEDVYQLKKFSGELESNAANWHWSMVELLPILDAQLKEMRSLIRDIEDYLGSELQEISRSSRISAYKRNWNSGEFFQFPFSL